MSRGDGRKKKAPRQDEVIVDGPKRRYVVLNPPDWPAVAPAPATAAPSDAPTATASATPMPRVGGTLRVLAAEAQALPMPDLGAETGRAAFMRLLFEPTPEGGEAKPAFDLVVLDGLSVLLRSARGRNDPAREFAEFLSSLRRARLAVLLVDRIRPRRRIAPPYEDMLDAIITVKRPPGLGESGGVHMAIHLAGRAFEGEEQFELRLELSTEQGPPGWRRVARLDAAVLAAWRLERQGLSCRAMGRELGVSPATAWRLVRRAEALPPEVLEAAALEMEGDLLPAVEEGETAATVEMGETPEPPRGTQEWVDWTLRRLWATVVAERNGVTPAQAARTWGALLKATRAPPGVFLQGERWKQMDRAIFDRLATGLNWPERQRRPDDFSDVPSLRDRLGPNPAAPPSR